MEMLVINQLKYQYTLFNLKKKVFKAHQTFISKIRYPWQVVHLQYIVLLVIITN